MYLEFLTTIQIISGATLLVVLTINVINQLILLDIHKPKRKLARRIELINKYSPIIIGLLVVVFIVALTFYFLFSNKIYNISGVGDYFEKMRESYIQGS